MLDSNELVALIVIVLAVTMYIRVELDFKRNAFRIFGHIISSILLALLVGFELGVLDITLVLWWLLFSSAYLLVNEIIRIYLRKHKMNDILQNHPRLYWLTRGKLKAKG